MTILLFIFLTIYCVYLNLRIKDIDESLGNCDLDKAELEIKLYNKMMEIRKELKKGTNEKSRRKPTKVSRRVPKVKVSQSEILRKFRGDKNNLQAGGKG